MGAYNILIVKQNCPKCKQDVEFRIQFKYGDTWQYEYQIGDPIRWGGNDIGVSGVKKVVVDGVSEPCPICGKEMDFEILIESDIIRTVQQSTGKYDFSKEQESYIIIQKS